mmetsp:Transcript_19097/g.39340  ORF Transcript_19097/g.39340 Transcript_19097/m.39340 type:complete len:201 (-) Transcript_19097:644-1246(-)
MRDGEVAHARDEGAGIDQAVETAADAKVKESVHGPALLHGAAADDGGVREVVHDLAVDADLVLAVPELLREQVARCSAEAHTSAEEHVAAELLPARADLLAVVLHREGEDVLVEIVPHHEGVLAEQRVRDVEVLVVLEVEQVQGPDLLLLGAEHLAHGPVTTLLFLLVILLPFDPGAGQDNPALVLDRRPPLAVGPVLTV